MDGHMRWRTGKVRARALKGRSSDEDSDKITVVEWSLRVVDSAEDQPLDRINGKRKTTSGDQGQHRGLHRVQRCIWRVGEPVIGRVGIQTFLFALSDPRVPIEERADG